MRLLDRYRTFGRRAAFGAALASGLMLAACSGTNDAAPTAEANGTAPRGASVAEHALGETANAGAAANQTVGGDGSQIVLNTLSAADIEGAQLAGELGCSFAATGGQAPLLVAMGDVASKDAAQGVVKVASYVERIAAPGGFDGMIEGATFSGAGKTIGIAVTGPAAGGGESPPRPATLTYDRADGAKRVFAGEWVCGP